MKLNLKFNATKVDEIEQERKLPIEECLQDTSINNLSLFIRKGLIDENGASGASKAKALDIIDQYLQEDEKTNLVFDIMEALVEGGFLTRQLDVKALREKVAERSTQVQETIEEM